MESNGIIPNQKEWKFSLSFDRSYVFFSKFINIFAEYQVINTEHFKQIMNVLSYIVTEKMNIVAP